MQHPQRQGDVCARRQDDVVANTCLKRIEELGAINRHLRRLDLPMRQGCGIMVG
jgi:hypothetical protein